MLSNDKNEEYARYLQALQQAEEYIETCEKIDDARENAELGLEVLLWLTS